VARRCVPESEIYNIMTFCHSYVCGGHFGGHRTAAKVLQSGFYWPTLFCDAHLFCLACEHCQCTGSLSHHDMIALSPILVVEIFNAWGIDFMGPSPHLLTLFTYWLLLIMCQSGWRI